MSESRLVYSSSGSPTCRGCHKPLRKCRCHPAGSKKGAAEQVIKIGRETKGRKGKGVTLISGLPLSEVDLKILAKQLKALCGSGGTIKNGVIEIQGDHRERLKPHLEKQFKQVKLAGG